MTSLASPKQQDNKGSAFPLVSVIIRTKNEEKWIGSCLESVFNQDYPNFEVIVVDNESTDHTVKKALKYNIKLVTIKEYRPGLAINIGIRASSGEIVVLLSGHCVPVNNEWLSHLVTDLSQNNVAGVYGRQEPLSFSSALDKRDLAITFGLDKKIQQKDSFFHNANSALRREIWDAFPFDEEVTNIEDRVWGAKVVAAGFNIVYEPLARVYHHHGIHHGRNLERAEKIVRIMEDLHGDHCDFGNIAVNNSRIVAIVPIRGEPLHHNGDYALEFTMNYLKSSNYVDEIVVSTDCEETAALARDLGASTPFLRPKSLSESYIDIAEVLAFSLEKIEEKTGVVDLVVIMEETHPFRPAHMLDEMITNAFQDDLDTLVASQRESRKVWLSNDTGTKEVSDESFIPRNLRMDQFHIGLMGLCCVTRPQFIRDKSIFGSKMGLYPTTSPLSLLEIRDANSLADCLPILKTWTE